MIRGASSVTLSGMSSLAGSLALAVALAAAAEAPPAVPAAPEGVALAATPTGLPETPPASAVLPVEEGDPFAVGVWPARPFQGSLLVVDVAGTAAVKKVRGTFGGKPLRWHKLGKTTWRGLAPVKDGAKPGETPLELTVDVEGAPAPGKKKGKVAKQARRWALAVEEVAFDKDELRVDPKFTKLPADALAKIAADKELLKAMWAKGSAAAPRFRKNFVKPRDDRTTAPYGTRRTFNGKQKSVHYGWDIDGNVGDPVVCDNDGVVLMAADLYYSGGTLFLDHGAGIYTAYFHLSDFAVKEGDTVKRGQPCGKVGKSGRVTGPHLHWAAKLSGSYLHPETLLLFDFEKPLVTAPVAAPLEAAAP